MSLYIKAKQRYIFFLDCVVRRLLNLKSRLTFKSFVFRRMQRLEGFSILNIKIKEKGKCRDGNLIKKSKASNKLTYGPCTLSPIMIIWPFQFRVNEHQSSKNTCYWKEKYIFRLWNVFFRIVLIKWFMGYLTLRLPHFYTIGKEIKIQNWVANFRNWKIHRRERPLSSYHIARVANILINNHCDYSEQ